MQPQLSEFGIALLYIVVGIVFACGGLFSWYMIRPYRPNEQKNSPYECGEEAIGTPWGNFNIRFYIVALIFILFDVEIVFLFPWAVIFGNENLIQASNGLWGWFSLFEMFLFVSVLTLGLAYAWSKGCLDWVKPEENIIDFKGKVPLKEYEKLNQK